MNAEVQVKDTREWLGLRLTAALMAHLEGKACIPLQATVAMHKQEPSSTARFSGFSKKKKKSMGE